MGDTGLGDIIEEQEKGHKDRALEHHKGTTVEGRETQEGAS